MNSLPEIEVAFELTGHGIALDEITAALGLMPSRTWRSGDSVQNTLLKRKSDCWLLGVPPRATFDMEATLIELLDMIEPHQDKIADVVRRFNLDAQVSFGVYIKGQTPILNFTAKTLGRLAAIRADLDVDLILTK